MIGTAKKVKEVNDSLGAVKPPPKKILVVYFPAELAVFVQPWMGIWVFYLALHDSLSPQNLAQC